jgi:hypothetical protein
MTSQRRAWWWDLALLVAVVLLAPLLADLAYTSWPYPHAARGSAALQQLLDREWQQLIRLGIGSRFSHLAYGIHDALYFMFFKCTGLDYLISGAPQAAQSHGFGKLMASWVLASSEFWRTAMIGLSLFSARLAVLVTCLPLIALTAIGAGADGLLVWMRRRSAAARESGFVYHRAKRLARHALWILAIGYLTPPWVLDPRIYVTAFAVAFAFAIRIAVGSFKKYL